MYRFIDLHLHTNCSDGSDAPEEVVARAARIGFAAIAITDHDTVAGVPEAGKAAHESGLEFLSGAEISTTFAGTELHVVGLGIRLDHPALCDALSNLRQDRTVRANEIIRRLNNLGLPVDRAQVQARAGCAAIGRLHIARELHARGMTPTIQKAFDKYIGKGRKAYVPKQALDCREAIDLIQQAGGLAFLAHPGVGSNTKRLLPRLLEIPFDGIEVYHTKHTAGQVAAFTQLAQEHGLLVSGGSDCHGAATDRPPDMGKVRVPYADFRRIRDTLHANT